MKPDGTRRTKKIAIGDDNFKATSRKKSNAIKKIPEIITEVSSFFI